nr:substrate-binding domain-containing protein [uncultured Ruegeria sp.]
MHPQLFDLVSLPPIGSSPPWKIGFANASRSNPWRVALERSVTEKHARLSPWISDIIVRNAEDDAEQQASQLEELVSLGIDALVISASPQTNHKLTSSLRRCMKRGLPVVALDRRPVRDDCYTVFVTASDDLIGRLSAIWLSEHLKGEGNVWLLSGLRGASPTERRLKAALSVFEELPNVAITAHRYTTWTREGGRSSIEELLSRSDQIPDGVWSDSGLQGLGSIDAFLTARVPIPPHTGGDVNGIYRAALKNRIPLCAIDYPSSMGAKAIDTAIALLRGESTTRRIEAPTPVILTKGYETKNVKADIWAEDHTRWDLPDDALLS